jgi:hypothetical protein
MSRVTGGHKHQAAIRTVVVVLAVAGAFSFLSGSVASAAVTRTASAGAASEDWPVFHGGPLDQGVAPSSTLTTANAASAGALIWQTNFRTITGAT